MLVEAEATVEKRGTDHRMTVRVCVDLAASQVCGMRECLPTDGFDVVYLPSQWDYEHDVLDWDGTSMFDACRAGAWSGASFASRAAGRVGWCVELRPSRVRLIPVPGRVLRSPPRMRSGQHTDTIGPRRMTVRRMAGPSCRRAE